MKKIFTLTTKFLLVVVLLLVSGYLQAQVTVGGDTAPNTFSILELSTANAQGGLRLPHLSTNQRNALDFSSNPSAAHGLVIYNTTTQCMDYWNNGRWVSLCEGNSQMVILPAPCTTVNADGTGCDSDFGITDPDCPAGPFTFTIVAGSDYASLADIDEGNGSFKVKFQPNNSISQRSIVVRVTSTCSSLYKDFLFSQQGQDCNTALGEVPEITSVPAITGGTRVLDYCAGGSVYLSIPFEPTGLDEIIWTRNEVEIARGVNHITVTQAGIYNVYKGIIGCNKKNGNAITINKGSVGAPSPVQIVVKGNNGIVCGAGDAVKLVAQKTSGSGTVRWFLNGILQPLTTPDNEVDATEGDWFAAVNDGDCWSKASEVATVYEETGATGPAAALPIIAKSSNFCQGSSVQLTVSNYDASCTYTWYENNTQIGVGQSVMYKVPEDVASVVIRCRATKPGSCASEAIGTETISTGGIPPRPLITGNMVLCSGTGTLNAVSTQPGNYTYAWYKDSQLVGTDESLDITSGGDYYVSITEVGGCTSPLAHRYINEVTSAAPTITLNSSSQNPNLNDVVTFAATIDFTPATNYNWTLTNATLESGGGNTPNAVVKFGLTGSASVRVEVSNACGTSSKTYTVANVSPACANPVEVYPSANTVVNTITEQGKTLGPVSATFDSGAPTAKYQWYKNTIGSTTGGTAISGATNNTYVANESISNTYYYYCEVSNAGCVSATMASGVFTLEVSVNPGLLELGSGIFTGRTCFDINKSNYADGCGTESVRNAYMVNFATLGTVNYTFTASATGTKRDLRFIVVDNEGCIESYSGGKPGPLGNNEVVTLSVDYKTNLSLESSTPKIWGRTREQAAKVQIYAVYNDGVKDVSLPLTVSIQDCICCPGYLAQGGAANGKDLCFYMTDAKTVPVWSVGKSGCEQAKEGFIDAEYRALGGWRLPTLPEMQNIQSVGLTLSQQPASSAGTTNFVSNWYMTNTYSGSTFTGYQFSNGGSTLAINIAAGAYVRCVREF